MREKLELRPAHWQSSIDGEKTISTPSETQTDTPAPIFPVLDTSLLPVRVADVDIALEWIIELFHE